MRSSVDQIDYWFSVGVMLFGVESSIAIQLANADFWDSPILILIIGNLICGQSGRSHKASQTFPCRMTAVVPLMVPSMSLLAVSARPNWEPPLPCSHQQQKTYRPHTPLILFFSISINCIETTAWLFSNHYSHWT